MSTLFISDLHLDPGRADIIQQFVALTHAARNCEALYILGDFVEYWIGDDDREHGLDAAFNALHALAQSGVAVYLMHGNRDFLMGGDFAERYQVQLIDDPYILDLYGNRTLLMHGDTLCTDDIDYQNFRKKVRDPQWQEGFLKMPIAERRKVVHDLRESSQQAMDNKPDAIMDVNLEAVDKIMREHQCLQLIHGHTHRPDIHHFKIDSVPAKRIVLGDWYSSGHILKFNANAFTLQAMDFNTEKLSDLG